jgi:hypothetical protein
MTYAMYICGDVTPCDTEKCAFIKLIDDMIHTEKNNFSSSSSSSSSSYMALQPISGLGLLL